MEAGGSNDEQAIPSDLSTSMGCRKDADEKGCKEPAGFCERGSAVSGGKHGSGRQAGACGPTGLDTRTRFGQGDSFV